MDKKEIRKLIKAEKAALSRDFIEAYSVRLAEKAAELPAYREASVLYAYLSYNEEIVTDALIRRAWADGKRVAVPKVLDDGVMEFYYMDSFDEISLGYCDIPEPAGDPSRLADEKDVLMLMPGLAFGRDRNRIGYGGGFYDRYLERKQAEGTRFRTLALAYDFQIFDTIPAEAHDSKVDLILSERELIEVPQTDCDLFVIS